MFPIRKVLYNLRSETLKRSFHASSCAFEVKEITNPASFRESVLKSPIAFVDFYATWCGPCKMIAPYVEKFSDIHTNINFFKVDVDELSDVAHEHGISAMPTFLVFKHGKVVDKIVGANPQGIHSALVKACE
ncbi:uncharacterized protein C5L36_0A02800 [Pichia kudriavzevii]|uniref:Thioredoxin domain-containing protein n=1 Tax=Pichia kudriavzevii TaxID=4909 RepID=A0A2U9QXH0_PICKU|nr:uncharacterized protein C5L36_0A02800 [Pichia kudriavzevii]AWU73677.1 hypothetical protein C5L36_0A02800 [Pichia kudriavzevii]